ncbi:MAG: hypothetical protein C4536_09065 [Actinobacteria bacterium]|jgi:hypothetical protein|nr:MAG: hypothetical protein C4536_09065 [Actinomycetota bacterium]
MVGKTAAKVYTSMLSTFVGSGLEDLMVGRRDFLLDALRQRVSGIEFIAGEFVKDFSELEGAYDRDDIDGVLVISEGPSTYGKIWYNRALSEAEFFRKKPTVIANDPSIGAYASTYTMTPFFTSVYRSGLPVIPVIGTHLDDMVPAMHLLEVIHRMKEARLLLMGDYEIMPHLAQVMYAVGGEFDQTIWVLDFEEHIKRLKEIFGTEVIIMNGWDFRKDYYEAVPDGEAQELAVRFIAECMALDGPTREEVVGAARWVPAVWKAVGDTRADAVCLLEGMGGIKSHPCFVVSELNDAGIPMFPIAQLDTTVTMLMMYYLTGKIGYGNETWLDIPEGRVLHQQCCAPRTWGLEPDSPRQRYDLRICCMGGTTIVTEPGSGVVGETATSVHLSLPGRFISIHQGEFAGAMYRERGPDFWGKDFLGQMRLRDFTYEQIGCHHKYIVKTDHARRIWENWTKMVDLAGGTKSLYIGDYKDELRDLATLLQLDLVQEDLEDLDYDWLHRNLFERRPFPVSSLVLPSFEPYRVERMQSLVDRILQGEVGVQDLLNQMARQVLQLLPKLMSEPEFKDMQGGFMHRLPELFERLKALQDKDLFLKVRDVGLYEVELDPSAAMRMDFDAVHKLSPLEESELSDERWIGLEIDPRVLVEMLMGVEGLRTMRNENMLRVHGLQHVESGGMRMGSFGIAEVTEAYYRFGGFEHFHELARSLVEGLLQVFDM